MVYICLYDYSKFCVWSTCSQWKNWADIPWDQSRYHFLDFCGLLFTLVFLFRFVPRKIQHETWKGTISKGNLIFQLINSWRYTQKSKPPTNRGWVHHRRSLPGQEKRLSLPVGMLNDREKINRHHAAGVGLGVSVKTKKLVDVGGLKQVDGFYVRHVMSSSDNPNGGVCRDFWLT